MIRKAAGKQIGTIVIPVFIDESEDADHVLSQSAFEPVWQVLKALRAHDRRLADDLDQLRLSLGRRSNSGGRISLPDNCMFPGCCCVTSSRRSISRRCRTRHGSRR